MIVAPQFFFHRRRLRFRRRYGDKPRGCWGDLPLVTLGGVRTLLGLNEKKKSSWVCFGLERDCLTDITDTGKRILCECVL
jgi:hypothetical protein